MIWAGCFKMRPFEIKAHVLKSSEHIAPWCTYSARSLENPRIRKAYSNYRRIHTPRYYYKDKNNNDNNKNNNNNNDDNCPNLKLYP